VLDAAKKIEWNINEFKIHSELENEEKSLNGLKKYVERKLKEGEIKLPMIAREALILSNPTSLVIKEIDKIILDGITEDLFTDLFDFIAELFDDARIDFCNSFVNLMLYIEENDDLITVDEFDRKLVELVRKSYNTLRYQEEFVDSEEVN